MFQNMGDRSPRAEVVTAVGSYQEFWTHRLTAGTPPPAGARRDSFGSSSKNCACQLPLDPIDEREAATLVALLSGEGTQAPTPGEAAAPYGRALLTCLKPIGHEECPSRLDVILDLSDTTSLPSSEQLRAVTEKIGELRGSVRFGACAIVVRTDAWFGTAQVFEVLAARSFSATRVFREAAATETWLADQGSTG